MNIFYLSNDVAECARQHCDKHVVKMVLEYAQLLSTAHVELDGNQVGYKSTHKNHPCAKWVRESNNNYNWLYCLWSALSLEYEYRYYKTHKSWEKLNEALSVPPVNIPVGHLTTPPQCMPDEYKGNNTIIAYRAYYLGDKQRMLSFKRRGTPPWITKKDPTYQEEVTPSSLLT